MQIILYKNNSDSNVIGKDLTNSMTLTGKLQTPTDVLSPSIEIKMFEGFEKYNYVYIPIFSRYYFITGFSVVDGDKLAINMGVDVLESYKDEIKKLDVHVTRQEAASKSNFYLQDNRLVTTGRHLTYVKKANSPVTIYNPGNNLHYTYVLNSM